MDGMTNITILRAAFVFVVGALISCAAWSDTKPVEMIVSLKSAKTVVVRAMPNQESDAIAFVDNGKALLRKGGEETNGFVMVQLADGRTGWTKSAFLAPSTRANLPESQPVLVLPAVNVQTVKPVMAQPRESLRPNQEPAKRQGGAGKGSMELWIIGLVGMLIGLLIGGKAGMVYATKSIHERYIVID